MSIQFNQVYTRKEPYDYTETIPKVIPYQTRKHGEYTKAGKFVNHTFVYYRYCEDIYLRARNWSERSPRYLDGMVGCVKLREFNRYFKTIQN